METTNSLMRGDWIHCADNEYREGYDAQIAEVYTNSIFTEDCEFEGEEIPINEVSPIPLTPEILLNNGFERELDEDNFHHRYSITVGTTYFSIRYVRSVFQWVRPLDFKYLHQLQHALKLAEIEMDIKSL